MTLPRWDRSGAVRPPCCTGADASSSLTQRHCAKHQYFLDSRAHLRGVAQYHCIARAVLRKGVRDIAQGFFRQFRRALLAERRVKRGILALTIRPRTRPLATYRLLLAAYALTIGRRMPVAYYLAAYYLPP